MLILTLHYPRCEKVLVIWVGGHYDPPGISQNEATEACERSNLGLIGIPSSSRLFPVGLHVYFTRIHVVLSSESP